MKVITLITILFMALKISAEEKAANNYIKGLHVLKENYKKDLAKELKGATQVEIFLLNDDVRIDPFMDDKKRFWLIRDDASVGIRKEKKLTKDEVAIFLKAIGKQLILKNSGKNGPQRPTYGIRVYIGQSLLFESLLCPLEGSMGIRFPDGKRDGHATGAELNAIMEKLMPATTDKN